MNHLNELLESILKEAAEADSPNRLNIGEVKESLLRYLTVHEGELSRFPELAGEPHWDVLISDFACSRDSFFMVAIFSGEEVELVAGHGERSALRVFVDTEYPEDVLDVIPELKRQFTVYSRSLTAPQEVIKTWLAG